MELDQTFLTQFGIMNKLSTGNMVLDVMVCLLIPAIMAKLNVYLDMLKAWLNKKPEEQAGYTRKIEYATAEGYYWYDENNSRNKVLQDAILLYLDTKPDVIDEFENASFQLIKGGKSQDEDGDFCDSDSDCDYRSKEIRRYKVQTLPPMETTFEVEPNVNFTMNKHKEESDKRAKHVLTFTLTCKLKDARERIEGFVDKALNHYKEMEGQKKDEARYLYTPLFCGSSSSEDGNKSMLFKRYQLSDEKTFKSFFHPEKEGLLRLLDHFMHKTGKFGIPGYPHKLGLLLHGPPGTGKTSLIKAIAHYTKRHIISIPLSRVKTNQELTDLVFDQACRVEGDDWTYKLPFKKTIFVMEDIDAAADVVHKRDEDPMAALAAFLKPATPPSSVKDVEEKKDGEKKDAASGSDDSDDSKKSPKKKSSGGKGGFGPALPGLAEKWLSLSDELNLAGILNVLDGVVDCPERIVVMTTNHPEKLDPALIRPGRINRKLFLGYMTIDDAMRMAGHYYEEMTSEEEERLRNIFPDKMTPAALESMCADCDTMEELLAALVKYAEKMKDEED